MMVVFSGLDGSGKSTQIGLLKSFLEKSGRKPYVFWSRGGYTPGFQFLKDLSRKLFPKALPKPGKSEERTRALSNPSIQKTWLTIALIDLIFYYSVFLRLKKMFGYVIICDRYLLDTEIDFTLSYPHFRTRQLLLWKVLMAISLKPEVTFVSLIPVGESVKRSKQKFEPFPDTPAVLAERLSLYKNAIGEETTFHLLDGLMNVDDIHKIILHKLKLLPQ